MTSTSPADTSGTPMPLVAPTPPITRRCRRGVSPAIVAGLIGRSIEDLEQIIGTDVPAFVQLTGGFRAGSSSRPQVA